MILTAGLTDHHFLTILKKESLEKISLRMLTLKTIVLLSALAGNTYELGKTQHIELGESSVPSSSIRRLMPSPFKKMFGERSGPRSICISPSEYLLLNLRDSFTGKKGELTPHRRMWDMVGGDNFSEIGHQFLRYFIDFGLVKPEDDVLHIGCGVRRMAVPLTKYLDSNSVYEGLEVYTRSFR